MPQPAKRTGFSADAEKVSFAFGALAGATTEATAVLELTLTRNARLFHALGIDTDKPVLFARKRIEADPASNPVFFASVVAAGVAYVDLRSDMVGFHAGDKIYAFAPAALAAGTIWLAFL